MLFPCNCRQYSKRITWMSRGSCLKAARLGPLHSSSCQQRQATCKLLSGFACRLFWSSLSSPFALCNVRIQDYRIHPTKNKQISRAPRIESFGHQRYHRTWTRRGAGQRPNCALRGTPVLCIASKLGHTEVVKFLVEADTQLNRVKGCERWLWFRG